MFLQQRLMEGRRKWRKGKEKREERNTKRNKIFLKDSDNIIHQNVEDTITWFVFLVIKPQFFNNNNVSYKMCIKQI
jgi:hypothetical protein